ncbi:MAG: DUF1150 domain-containing protein [Alphaproteobacteria bacterium]|nr:DUF1150 domain-containing protein [Alphaproteobacteria bacterium]MBU1526637.1 DUF1150 domain-containing protein [Alphaproteobacteria bacterium]MBU2118571.1 DUF1150 domain-containing protein [Alphaproteobacteria bacterium]MBU2351236.1 DUF1150 domain-containing protein [Alphaproteobacteria bacterium]MBU2381467.1 DUF1150 domain-containing protein [Alphaproteobacteria bacterium]
MSPSMTKRDLAELGAPDMVYVRQVAAADILGDAPSEALKGLNIDPDQILYAVHSADGERLAVLIDREAAFAAAVAHELDPVSVH